MSKKPFGGKEGEVGSLFGFRIDGLGSGDELFDGGLDNVIVGIDKPNVFTLGLLNTKVACSSGTRSLVVVGFDKIGTFLSKGFDESFGIIGRVVVDEENFHLAAMSF